MVTFLLIYLFTPILDAVHLTPIYIIKEYTTVYIR